MRGATIAATTLVLSAVLAACGSDPNSLAAQARAGNGEGFISGDGSVERIASSRRATPLRLQGRTLEGNRWALSQVTGNVVVLNMWGSWCGPCVAEAPDLQKAWALMKAQGKPVTFMGLNVREGPEAGLAFERKYHITYPSLAEGGDRPVPALQGRAPTVPTTLILDPLGRIAARVVGQTGTATLTGLVDDVLAESRP